MSQKSPIPRTDLSVLLGGWTEAGRYIVRFGSEALALTHCEFEHFVRLVHARLTTPTGLTNFGANERWERMGIYQVIKRIRRAIDTLDPGYGKQLIPAPTRGWYKLDIDPAKIIINPGLFDLAPHHLPQKIVDELRTFAATDNEHSGLSAGRQHSVSAQRLH